jgi:hypothetical protein|tara:strand:+ start:476 stop:862 length:387 start_codon:yes stop_codon:yes gene_type:complete
MKFYELLFFFVISYACKAQTLNPDLNQAEQEIIGTWILENDSNTKLIFQSNGTVKTYYSNTLNATHQYEISNSCNGETLNNQLFLKTLNNQNKVIDCSYLDSINYNNSGKMTLVSQNQGKVIVLNKQP